MQGVIYGIIERGEYKLEELIGRIDYFYCTGQLTADERNELVALAREKAAETLGADPKEEIMALWARVRNLQKEIETLKGGQKRGGGTEEFVQPKGIRDAYETGDTVLFEGKEYRSISDNNVWSPEVNPNVWEEVEQDGDDK